jgi:hypothetical protein
MNILGLKIDVDRSPTSKIKWSRRAIVIGVANIAVISGGVAFASWSTNGFGTGAAKAGAAVPVGTVTAANASTAGGASLYPTLSVVPVVTVANTNPFPVTVTKIDFTAQAQPDSVIGGIGGTCNPGNSAVSMSTGTTGVLATGVVIPANSTGTPVLATGASVISMGAGSNNGCQQATFVFNLTTGTTVAVTAGS